MSSDPNRDADRNERVRQGLTWRDVHLLVVGPADLLAAANRLLGLRPEAVEARASRAEPDVDVIPTAGGYVLRSRVENCTAPCREDALLKLVALISYFFMDMTEATVLHAGAFAGEAGAVVFCGPPLAGKSTLALAAWRRGHEVLGDDWLALDANGTAGAFPKPIKARLASRALPVEFQLPPEDHVVGLLGDEIRLALGRGLPRMVGFDARSPVAALFLIERVEGPTSLAPVPRDVALLTMLTQTMRSRGSRLGAVALLEKLRREDRVARLRVGENDVEGALDAMVTAASRGRPEARR